jgi:hypothetical protein
MKNSTRNSNFHDNSSKLEEDKTEKLPNLNSSSKAVKLTMTEQIVIPPARVWDKIEKILDEQESRRKDASNMITSSFAKKKHKKVYVATLAGISIAAGIMLIIL